MTDIFYPIFPRVLGKRDEFFVLDGGFSTQCVSHVSAESFTGRAHWTSELIDENPEAVPIVAPLKKQWSLQIRPFLKTHAIPRKAGIVGSLGPYAAFLASGSEYNGDKSTSYPLSEEELKTWHKERIRHMMIGGVDVIAFETIPSIKEAILILDLIDNTLNAKCWISFQCKDSKSLAYGDSYKEASAQGRSKNIIIMSTADVEMSIDAIEAHNLSKDDTSVDSIEAQNLLKDEKSVDAMEPIITLKKWFDDKTLELPTLEEFIKSPIINGYRNKCEFTIGLHPKDRTKVQVGFRLSSYKEGNTSVVNAEDVPFVPEPMKKLTKFFEELVTNSGYSTYDPISLSGHWKILLLRINSQKEVLMKITFNPQLLEDKELETIKDYIKQKISHYMEQDHDFKIVSTFLRFESRTSKASSQLLLGENGFS
ncbi:TRMT2A [Lepeophtheirus salmonis]|uniref:TRMT2A n=1 Tax=Lepeophtheirus salmonis TaxID=72036 RepID=A0A7R8HB90_LEPSM|nr:TRMT2A [Lepeophtheirus salmonis]CAF2977830.1 TRMT2A [Lepeophtheirus salmonis]